MLKCGKNNKSIRKYPKFRRGDQKTLADCFKRHRDGFGNQSLVGLHQLDNQISRRQYRKTKLGTGVLANFQNRIKYDK